MKTVCLFSVDSNVESAFDIWISLLHREFQCHKLLCVLTRAANSIFLPNSNLNSKLKILWDSNSKIFKASSSSFLCVVHTLQLAIKDGLKLPNCDKLLTKTRHIVTKLRSPNILSLLEKRGKKRPILDMTTRWASTYLMIKRLLELRESIGELSLLSPELHISLAMWSSLEDIGSVLEIPYSVTVTCRPNL